MTRFPLEQNKYSQWLVLHNSFLFYRHSLFDDFSFLDALTISKTIIENMSIGVIINPMVSAPLDQLGKSSL